MTCKRTLRIVYTLNHTQAVELPSIARLAAARRILKRRATEYPQSIRDPPLLGSLRLECDQMRV